MEMTTLSLRCKGAILSVNNNGYFVGRITKNSEHVSDASPGESA